MTPPLHGVAPPGDRLPAGTRPGAVRLQVADLDRSLAWYERITGLGALDRSDGVARLGAPAGEETLVELRERPGASSPPPRGRLGLFHYALLLPDRRQLGRFVRHLAGLGVPAGASDHGVSEALYLTDPDGLGIEVYADRPRSAWKRRGRELVMITAPLDLDDLVAAAGGRGWDGMPDGTVVGHVHLHVGDLVQASAFYHEALGLDRVVWSYPGALFLAAGGYHHHLGVNTWAAGAPAPGEDEAKLLEWELRVPDRDEAVAALDRLANAGHDVERDEHGGGRARDPWGTPLRIRPAETGPG